MRVAIRADAGRHIGTGHIMRCLTLAEALRQRGASVSFICRSHPGNLLSFVQEKGFVCHDLGPVLREDASSSESDLSYTSWLGMDWQTDLAQTKAALENPVDLLVVDHYALDTRWEAGMRGLAGRILVIDDLADRAHDADILLDQNFGRQTEDYTPLVSEDCWVLTGSDYALLRPEFARLRPTTLERRRRLNRPRSMLISLGGNMGEQTERVVELAAPLLVRRDFEITVVSGFALGAKPRIEKMLERHGVKGTVYGQADNMAELMSAADIAIGGTGATTWERCCLGVPTLSLVLAENQRFAARRLDEAGILYHVKPIHDLEAYDIEALCSLSPQQYRDLVEQSAAACDGQGVERVLAGLPHE